jgi:hypothetical protein
MSVMNASIESFTSCAGHRLAISSIRAPRPFNSSFGKSLSNCSPVAVKALFGFTAFTRSIVSSREFSIFEPKHVYNFATLHRIARRILEHPGRDARLAGRIARSKPDHVCDYAQVGGPGSDAEFLEQPSRSHKLTICTGVRRSRALARVPLL